MSDHYILLATQKQREALVAERDALRAQVAALVAERDALADMQRPVAFSEREPEDGASVLYWDKHQECWCKWIEYVRGWRASEATHWLPMPPAPEAQP